MWLYVYDLKVKDLDGYNTIKRRFYYRLKNSKLGTRPWKTKSVLLVDDELEREADAFFREWRPYILVYKARIKELIKLE